MLPGVILPSSNVGGRGSTHSFFMLHKLTLSSGHEDLGGLVVGNFALNRTICVNNYWFDHL